MKAMKALKVDDDASVAKSMKTSGKFAMKVNQGTWVNLCIILAIQILICTTESIIFKYTQTIHTISTYIHKYICFLCSPGLKSRSVCEMTSKWGKPDDDDSGSDSSEDEPGAKKSKVTVGLNSG